MKVLGLAVALALAYVVAYKLRVGEASDILWMCYPSAAVLSLGLILGWRMMASVGSLFYLAVGLPFWLIDLIATGTTSLASVAVHLIAPVAAVVHLKRHGVPPAAKYGSVLLYLLLSLASRLLTPASLNVNLAYGPYFAVPVPAWGSYIFNIVSGFLLLFGMEKLVNHFRS
jgi:hypothetical protein